MAEYGIKLDGFALSRFPESRIKELSSQYDWVYAGEEFCERLFVPAEVCKNIVFFQKAGMKVCALTPIFSDRGTESFYEFLGLLAKGIKDGAIDPARLEITANDFSAVNILSKSGMRTRLNLGRQLINNAFSVYSEDLCETSDECLDFFFRRGIERFEMSLEKNRTELVFSHGSPDEIRKRLRLTLFYPYMPVALSPVCLTGAREVGSRESPAFVKCSRSCAYAYYNFMHPWVKEPLTVKGNAVFVRRAGEDPSGSVFLKKEPSADRLIFCPYP